ncbi:protein downstream neighbor of son homolog [Ctenocephalides felis]|uniref:protein downstream neighbor of son homolog n=1 Tax=Ctenocephalides felis TaxID=7515 RepID=UPI000E6E47E4|nr:protein downstream neighbor of son homolog [Ctenocephalides felis]
MSQDISGWKKPDEVMRLHRIKLKKKALQARMNTKTQIDTKLDICEPQFVREKRKNPFSKENAQVDKRCKTVESTVLADSCSDSALFNLINSESAQKPCIRVQETAAEITPTIAENYLQVVVNQDVPVTKIEGKPKPPIDWTLKSKLRILSPTVLPSHPKTSQEASGVTSFVRCLHTSEDLPANQGGGLDTSLGARIQQSCLYWIHPTIPGEKLFPRKLRNSSVVAGLPLQAMLTEWSDSFRSLFQLLRAKQCPFFYLCANSFTALFRAGGIGGQVEPHALITPTSQGLRQTLKQEDIEFKMPLRKNDNYFNDSGDSGLSLSTKENSSSNIESCADDDDDDDEITQEQWLESLGVDDIEIKKINYSQARKDHATECKTDFSDISLILIQGPDLQALYNFLLNSKSTVGGVGVIPPTLLAPTAFVGATLKTLQTRFSRVKHDGVDHHSIELRGPILPNIISSLCNDLNSSRDSFSINMGLVADTRALTKAAKVINVDTQEGSSVFGKENLSSCGLSRDFLDQICSSDKDTILSTEQLNYQKDIGYTWT